MILVDYSPKTKTWNVIRRHKGKTTVLVDGIETQQEAGNRQIHEMYKYMESGGITQRAAEKEATG